MRAVNDALGTCRPIVRWSTSSTCSVPPRAGGSTVKVCGSSGFRPADAAPLGSRRAAASTVHPVERSVRARREAVPRGRFVRPTPSESQRTGRTRGADRPRPGVRSAPLRESPRARRAASPSRLEGYAGVQPSSVRPWRWTPAGCSSSIVCAYPIGRTVHSGTAIGLGSPNSWATHSTWARKPSGVRSVTLYGLAGAPAFDGGGHRAGRVGEFDPTADPAVVVGGGQLPLAQHGQDGVGAAGAVEEAEAEGDALQPGCLEGELFLGAHALDVLFQLRRGAARAEGVVLGDRAGAEVPVAVAERPSTR